MRMEARVSWQEREDKRNSRGFRQVRWEEKTKMKIGGMVKIEMGR